MVSIIVLAAGSSKRMGGLNKLLLPWENKTLIQHAVEICMQCNEDEVLVVLGHESSRIRNELQTCTVQFVENPGYSNGMLTSIKAGIQETSPETTGWMIFLGDQPKISVIFLNRLLKFFYTNYCPGKDLIVLPVCDGIQRNPVIFSQSFKKRLLSHQGDGGKALIESHKDSILELVEEDSKMFEDVDTPEAYDLLNQ